MQIELRSEHPVDDPHARAATGRTLGEWFAILDAFGGPARGRRDLGQHLLTEHQVDPWWIAAINIAYEAHHGLREKDGRGKGYTICATKTVKASPAACYRLLADPAGLDQWLGSGHRGAVREGERIENADGNRASVRKVNPDKVVRLVWEQAEAGAETPVEIKLQPAGAKTTVMVTHDRLQTPGEADGFRRAWGAALERFKAAVEG
jgi:uncharacterized protein YndB with AHSA1/START domain